MIPYQDVLCARVCHVFVLALHEAVERLRGLPSGGEVAGRAAHHRDDGQVDVVTHHEAHEEPGERQHVEHHPRGYSR